MNSIDHLNFAVEWPEIVFEKFKHHLSPLGASRLAVIGLSICPNDFGVELCEAFLDEVSAGYPTTSLFPERTLDDARFHASLSIMLERKAYCLAHYEHLPFDVQADFLNWANNQWKAAA